MGFQALLTADRFSFVTRRKRAQPLDHFRDDFERVVSIRLGIEPSQAEADARPCLRLCQSHRRQDVRRLERPRRARRAGGAGDAAQIESDHEGFAVKALEAQIRGVRLAARLTENDEEVKRTAWSLFKTV